MQHVEQWQGLLESLPADWTQVHVELRLFEPEKADRAVALLGPLGPSRTETGLRFYAGKGGATAGADAVRRLLGRLDAERLHGRLELLSSSEPAAGAPAAAAASLVADWDRALAELPADWSDLYCELELPSSDYHEVAALACAPLNPAGMGPVPGFRFRAARRAGYGVSTMMARRCLARLDEAGIPGQLRILRALADTHAVATQGPVWVVGGKMV